MSNGLKVPVYQALGTEKITFVVDSSFYPKWSSLIVAHFKALLYNNIIAEGDFISFISLEYRHPYLAKLCSTLIIIQLFIHTVEKIEIKLPEIEIEIRSDYLAVINALFLTMNTISLLVNLYQIHYEIKMLLDEYKIKVIPIKIKAH